MSPVTLEIDGQAVPIPNIRHQPSYHELCRVLKGLQLEPGSWSEATVVHDDKVPDSKAINNFLLSMVGSDLSWQTEEQREELYDLASKRMSERCGRSAMPEMTRSWIIPASNLHPELNFEIREPPITEDNLGFKTWGTAFAISKLLETLGNKYFSHVQNAPRNKYTTSSGSTFTTQAVTRILELGSGTGLVGIALATIWRAAVVLTDLPTIQENLHHNIERNYDIIKSMGGTATGKILDWKDEKQALQDFDDQKFEVVVAADPMYDDDHPRLVAAMIAKYLKHGRTPAALVAVPFRDKKTKSMFGEFVDIMRGHNLQLKHQGGEVFKDDWGSADDEKVTCWWSIWGWSGP